MGYQRSLLAQDVRSFEDNGVCGLCEVRDVGHEPAMSRCFAQSLHPPLFRQEHEEVDRNPVQRPPSNGPQTIHRTL